MKTFESSPVQQKPFIATIGKTASLLVLAGLTWMSTVRAATIHYTDWTSATLGTAGSASGTITLPDLSTIGVSYSGEVTSPTQTSGGTYYWTEGVPAPYTGNAVVDNTPSNSDIITLTGQNSSPVTQTITFSSPVKDPIMLILSLGQGPIPVNYDFNAPFNILSTGVGFWGGGAGSLVELAGDVLRGTEGHGAIQFDGTFTSISWTASPHENWHGFTIGVTANAVPEASGTLGMLLLAALFLGALRRNMV